MQEQEVACKICSSSSRRVFSHLLLQKYTVNYFQCKACGFTQPEEPYWLNEAYADSMNYSDTGQIMRNLQALKILRPLVHFFFDSSQKFLDFAGGYGLFTRLMRDAGLNFFWDDLYTPNLIGKGFERPKEKTQFEIITLFECFEHWPNPMAEIEALLKETDSVFFTTNLISRPAPQTDWWYYGFDHGQHVAFHSVDSLKFVAQKFGLEFYSKRGYHLLTRKKINRLAYKIVVEAAFRGYLNWVGHHKTRTQSDHELLVARKKEQKKPPQD